MVQRHTPKTLSDFPTAPGSWPLVGHLSPLLRQGREKLMEYSQELGQAFWLNLGFGNWVLHLDGELAHVVMKNKKTRSVMSDPRIAHALDHSMLIKNGEEHRKVRGSMNAPFTPKGLKAARVGEIIGEVLSTEIEKWSKGSEISVIDTTNRMTLDVIFRILGVPATDLPEWRQHYDDFFSAGAMIPLDFPGSPVRRSKQATQWLDQQFLRLMEEARKNGERETMIGAMAHATDEQGQSIPEKEVLANLRLLGFAGHETTAATMGWMMLHCAQDSELWENVCEEANAAEELPTTPKELSKFAFTEALFRECLRLYPPVILISREVIEPIEVDGKVIPEGTIVGASVVSLSMNPETYPEPEQMKPERWLGRERKPGPAEAVQFGGGPHFCLGYHMAVLEGTFFLVYAARALSKKGIKPCLKGRLPSPVYLPLMHPPKKGRVVFL